MSAGVLFSQPYPDQHYYYEKEGLVKKISSMNGLQISSDGKSIVLADGVLNGTAIFEPDSSQYPFNNGLPSWNGLVSDDNSGFRVLMRFYNNGWTKWITAGYWKANIWSSYGATTFTGGNIDVDEISCTSYFTKWQFQVEMLRTSASQPSPSLTKLSFFVSDQQTTSQMNITSIVNDKPDAIFIPTEFIYQYGLDNIIGGSICSPTSTSMVIRSYDIKVDALQFAKDNYDPKWKMYGVWPRTVENAARFGLNGAVTRYRTWSDARKILAAGGRVVMSVRATNFYSAGHLIMLAGFDAAGNPIVHDSAIQNGYSYIWDKNVLSQAWFGRGGVSYTFYKDSTMTTSVESEQIASTVKDFHVSNYPNPFNMQTTVRIETPATGYTSIKAYDISGREVDNLYEGSLNSGTHIFRWNPAFLPTGNYFIHVVSGNYSKTIKSVLLK